MTGLWEEAPACCRGLDSIVTPCPAHARELGFSLLQAVHTFNLFERNSACVFTAVPCTSYLWFKKCEEDVHRHVMLTASLLLVPELTTLNRLVTSTWCN